MNRAWNTVGSILGFASIYVLAAVILRQRFGRVGTRGISKIQFATIDSKATNPIFKKYVKVFQ